MAPYSVAMRYLGLIFLLFSFSLLAPAKEIYRAVGPDGKVIFSDTPIPGGEEIDLKPVQTYPAPRLPLRQPPEKAKPSAGYEHFSVITPLPNQSLRNAQGRVPVRLKLLPALHAGHRLRLFLDGQPLIGGEQSLSRTLDNLDRGAHEIYAVVVDQDDKEIIRTTPLKFFLHRPFR